MQCSVIKAKQGCNTENVRNYLYLLCPVRAAVKDAVTAVIASAQSSATVVCVAQELVGDVTRMSWHKLAPGQPQKSRHLFLHHST